MGWVSQSINQSVSQVSQSIQSVAPRPLPFHLGRSVPLAAGGVPLHEAGPALPKRLRPFPKADAVRRADAWHGLEGGEEEAEAQLENGDWGGREGFGIDKIRPEPSECNDDTAWSEGSSSHAPHCVR